MDICSSGHEEIVYDGQYCPFCYALEDLNRTIETLENIIRARDSELEALRDMV